MHSAEKTRVWSVSGVVLLIVVLYARHGIAGVIAALAQRRTTGG